MRSQRWDMVLAIALRIGASLAMAAMLLIPALRLAPSISAADPDPWARVMVQVNSIYVADDSDWGEGELNYRVVMQRTRPGCGGVCHGDLFEYVYSFGADSGETKSFEGKPDQFVPYYRPQPQGFYSPPQAGLDLYPGDSLLIKWNGSESDPVFDDWVGSFEESFDQGQNWGMGVVHNTSSRNTLGFGGFTVNYEIVRAPLPDLMVTDIRVGNFADNGDDIVCVMVENVQVEPAGPYTLRFYVDGVIPRNGEIHEAGVLGPVGHLERCFQTTIAAGQHAFVATVDEDQKLPEMNELNNSKAIVATIARLGPGGQRFPVAPIGPAVLDPGVDATATPTPTPSPTSTATPSPTPSAADLMPLSIRVKGKEPSGQNDCDPGRNDVMVQVRNQGGADAGSFAVVLLVDGDQDDGGKETVQSLDRGQQTDVRFDEVRLSKGTHELTAKVDAEGRIAESVETNNELKVSVTCKDEDD